LEAQLNISNEDAARKLLKELFSRCEQIAGTDTPGRKAG